MIKFENRHDEYAYRVANFDLDPSVTTLHDGQWVTLSNGKLVVADGTKKAFICTGSKRAGRDQISGLPVQKVAILVGAFVLSTDQFDTTGTYGELTPLAVKEGGILTPAGEDDMVAAYSVAPPNGGFLRIIATA